MTRFIGAARALRTAVVAMSLLAAGCGSESSQGIVTSQQGIVTINPAVLLDGIATGIQQPVARALGGWEWSSFLNSFGRLLTSISYTLEMRKVTYQSTGADGQVHTMTGLLILPK